MKYHLSDELIMYDIKYIKNLNSLNTLYLVFNNLDAYIEKSGENRYLIFASAEKNKIMLEIDKELWDEIKEQIELITGDKVIRYSKDFMKMRFKINDDLPLNKMLHDCFYEYEKDINPPIVQSINLICVLKIFYFFSVINIII